MSNPGQYHPSLSTSTSLPANYSTAIDDKAKYAKQGSPGRWGGGGGDRIKRVCIREAL